ncbi:MAG TPA: VOC family protein [Actinomycetes bacterium]|nr:VOC family protein [Actinomycetes bacterium]
MAIPAQLSIVTLGVGDLAKSREFYSALGWQQSSASNDEICWFQVGGCALGLFPYRELAADATVEATGHRGFNGVTLAINVGDPAGVDAALAEAAAAGAAIVKPGQKTEWGGYSGYFADRDGFLWEIAHNPFWPADEDGWQGPPKSRSAS